MDDDDKIRRNLVMASSAVILYYWLELPPGAIVSRVLGVTVAYSVDAYRIWLALFLVLAYFCYRFYFAVAHSEVVSEAKKEFIESRILIVKGMASKGIRKAIRRSTLQGTILRTVHSRVEGLADPDAIDPTTSDSTFDWKNAKVAEVIVNSPDATPWYGLVTVIVLQDSKPFASRNLFFNIDLMRQVVCDARALLTLKSTKVMPEVVLPVALAYAGLVLVAFGLGSALHL